MLCCDIEEPKPRTDMSNGSELRGGICETSCWLSSCSRPASAIGLFSHVSSLLSDVLLSVSDTELFSSCIVASSLDSFV